MKILNKTSYMVALLIALFSCVFLLASCSQAKTNGPIELTDLSGRTITLDAPAERVAALSAADCEILSALDAEDKIIARGTYCDYPESVKNIKDVGSGELTNIEELIATKPDVVLMSKTGFTLDQVNTMENAGLKTLVNEANTFEDTYSYIKQLGKLVGKSSEAEALVSSMKKSVDEFSAKTSGKEQKTVYFQLCLPQHGYWTAGANTFMNEMAQILHCKNVFDDVEG